MIREKRCLSKYCLIFLLLFSCLLPIFYFNYDFSSNVQDNINFPSSSAQRLVTSQWIKNPTFEAPIEPTWYWENGTDGDNSDMDASSGSGQANFEVMGETNTITLISGTPNGGNSPGWGIYNNGDFLLPDTAEIVSTGLNVYHYLDETSGPGQVHNFPSVHFKKNISLPDEMSDYVITDASLEVIFNASVNINVDTYNDWNPYASTPYIDWDKFLIGDSANLYAEISDTQNSYPFRVGNFETRDARLGEGDLVDPDILELSDTELNYVDKQDLIAALNTVLETDQRNFTINLGMDIYCEDNSGAGDQDEWNYLLFKFCNLTITYVKKIDQQTTLSWNQIGNKLDGASNQITSAKMFFKYKVNNSWPVTAPLSEIRFMINNKTLSEGIIKLSSATTSWQDAKVGGYDVTGLISTDVNITTSIEVYLKDSFQLDQIYMISIDEVYLNISYIETFPDYGTDLTLFLDGDDKTLDPVIQIPIEEFLNVTITYKDKVSHNHISADSAKLEGKVTGDFTELPALEQYYFSVNSSELGLGISVLTITIQKVNYETQSIQIFVEVIERGTEIHLLIDDIPKSNKETINVRFNEILNFTVFYEDNLTTTYISGASVEVLGFGAMNETINQYNFTLSTNDLSQGVNVLTVFAQKSNYKSQTIQVYINVVERATQLKLYVDSVQKFDSDTINSQFDEFLNITIFYIDDLTSMYIGGSSVELLGFGAMNETVNQYNFTLNTNDLVQGVNVLTIFAQKGNYQSQTIQFFINVQIRTTNVKFYVEGVERTDGDTINTQFDVILNVTVIYRDNSTASHLTGAVVDLLGFGSFDEIGTQFNFSIQTNLLVKGINILTIFAQLDGYQAQTIQFFINVDERATKLLLFINNNRVNQSATIQFEANELINITVFYKDYLTSAHLSGANVELLGVNTLDEINSQFNITINSNDLAQGINILTIFAQLLNYQPKSIQFFIDVVERATEMELLVNIGGIVSTDPIFEIAIGTTVNITIKFYDLKTGLEIPGAILQLIGETLFENLTENPTFNQYSIILTNLPLGLKLFTVIAQAPTYQINTTDLRITVNPVRALINTVSGIAYFDRSPNQDFHIQIVLNNTDFGGTITNATVTYRWANGQGILTDSDDDGIYEATLYNVPVGSYLITINAYAGENYDFSEEFEIVLNVIAPSGLDIIVIQVIIGLLVAGAVVATTAFVLYQTHFKYPPKVRMMRKLRKKLGKGKVMKPLAVSTRDDLIAGEIEANRSPIKTEKDIGDKINKKQGGGTIE